MRRRESHIFEKEARGHYVEPDWTSRRLFQVEKFTGPINDPACGWGTILHEARAAGFDVVGSDIVNRRRHQLDGRFIRRDFLESNDTIDGSVVCNPPFDHVEAFCELSLLRGASKVAMIMLTRRLNAAHWLRDLPLRRVWLLTPRPSMPTGAHIIRCERGEIDENTGEPCKIGGGTQDFCWLVFEAGVGRPKIDWLHRDERSA